MDARTAKRMAAIEHIRTKVYYDSDMLAPDPMDTSISTRHWKYLMQQWVNQMKRNYYSTPPSQLEVIPAAAGGA